MSSVCAHHGCLAEKLPHRELSLRREASDKILRSVGMLRHGEAASHPRFEGFDLSPHILGEDEWSMIESGLRQRTRALLRFVGDIHKNRNILQDKVIPCELVLGNPLFLRECQDITATGQCHFRWSACDLARDKNRRWIVLRDHLSIPVGLCAAIQNRRTLTQVMPELFDHAQPSPVSSFLVNFLENLKRFTDRDGGALALLSDATEGWSEFEHGFLARRLGIPIAHPHDLTVRNNTLCFRATHGLEPIQTLLRGMPGRDLDPVSFSSGRGVPGLMDCLRTGNLSIINSPGSAAAEHVGLLRMSDLIIRYYLNEDPILGALPTFLLWENDQLLEYENKPEQYCLIRWDGSFRKPGEKGAQLPIREHINQWVAHPQMRWDKLAYGSGGKETKRAPFSLRCFMLSDENETSVMQGGLTQIWTHGDPLTPAAFIAQDTWVRIDGHRPAHKERTYSVPAPFRHFLPSRIAENLYWCGRLLERAETTARFLVVLHELRPETSAGMEKSWKALWTALSSVAGHDSDYLPRVMGRNPLKTGRIMAFDRSNTASVASNLAAARLNASTLLDYISPEAWSVLNNLSAQFDLHDKRPASGGHSDEWVDLKQCLDLALNQITAFHGMISRTMPHDDGRNFLLLGVYLERAIWTLDALGEIYGAGCFGVQSGEHDESDIEDELLTVLLRVLCTMDAFRRKYQTRAAPRAVAEWVLFDKESPGSVFFVMRSCQNLLAPYLNENGDLKDACANLMQMLSQQEMEISTTPKKRARAESKTPKLFLGYLDAVRSRCLSLHDQVSDAFFTHQTGFNSMGSDGDTSV